jgi:hypothetical protein
MQSSAGYDVTFNSFLEKLLEKLANNSENSNAFPPSAGNRYHVYCQLKQQLYVKYYRDIDTALNTETGEPTAFTHHDISHVNDVIQKMGELLGQRSEAKTPASGELEPYEVFVLLVAALVHDVGNYNGRTTHTLTSRKMLREVASPTLDVHEIKLIADIAQAHAGRRQDNNKNTIGALQVEHGIGSIKVRVRLLAAILRLADELSENPARATSRTAPRSILANLYCQRVNCRINYSSRNLGLDFVLHDDEISRLAENESGNKVYFVDYIATRIVKTELERRYCNRFLQNFASYDELRVTVSFYHNDIECLEKIHFELQEDGFPDASEVLIQKGVLVGAVLAQKYQAHVGGDNG